MLAEVFGQVEKSNEPASGILPEEIGFCLAAQRRQKGPRARWPGRRLVAASRAS